MRNEKILVSAYSCEPNRGSEPGVGWTYVKEMSKFYYLVVLTRADKKQIIETQNLKNVEFHFINVPFFNKKYRYGFLAYLHYYLWQFVIYFYVKKNINLNEIKLAQHVTFVNSWTPSFLSFLKLKFIWGPIGQHLRVPYRYFEFIPFKYFILDRLRSLVRFFFRNFDPFYHLTKIKSKQILAINKESSKCFSSEKINILPAISVNPNDFKSYRNNENKRTSFEVYWAGNFIYWKGIDIVIDSFDKFSRGKNNVILNLIGDGAELDRIKKKAKSNNKIKFKGKLSQTELFNFISKQDLFFYPSFEGGGMITLESMAIGKPVLCLNFGGPGEMVVDGFNGFSIDFVDYSTTVNLLSKKLNEYYKNNDLIKIHGQNSISQIESKFNDKNKIEFLKKIYAKY